MYRTPLVLLLWSISRSWCIPIDLIVVTPEEVEKYRNAAGTVIRKAVREGKILYERAASTAEGGGPLDGEGRDPGDWEPITVAEAQLALEMAQAVRQAVLKQLPWGPVQEWSGPREDQ